MYDLNIDLTQERRSFRIEGQVFNLALESAWWQNLEAVCPSPDTRKGWISEWIAEARDRGCNRQALIRFRIHQLMLEQVQEERTVQLPALANLISLAEAKEHHCPFQDVATYYCKGSKCKHWQKDDRLRGFGKCKRLALELEGRA